MSKVPGVSSIYATQGGVECMIGEPGDAIPITIDGARLGSTAANITFKGPALYARRTASPYKAVPFMNSAAISAATNVTNATVTIPDADAVRFRVGDACTYYTIATGVIYATETRVISAIGAAGSGGAGLTTITFTGVWTTAPAATNLLVVADGAQLSANVVVVLEDVVFDGATDALTAGYIEGAFLASAVQNAAYFVAANNQRINLVTI